MLKSTSLMWKTAEIWLMHTQTHTFEAWKHSLHDHNGRRSAERQMFCHTFELPWDVVLSDYEINRWHGIVFRANDFRT